MTADVTKQLKILKNKIIVVFNRYLLKLQKGYLLEDHPKLMNAMMAIEFIEGYEISDEEALKIIEIHTLNIENER